MKVERGSSPDVTSISERVQTNSFMGSPLVVASILTLLLGFVAWRLLAGLSQEAIPPPTTFPPVETTLPEPPPAELALLIELGLNGSLAYAIEDGVAVIDLSTGQVVPVTEIAEILDPGDFAILRTDAGTFVIDKSEPTSIGRSEIEGDVVSTSDSERFVAVLFGGVNGGDPDVDLRYAYTLSGTYGVEAMNLGLVSVSEIARDSKHILVPGLGAVFEHPDGGSFIFDVNGYRPLSDHRVIAASSSARIELRCGRSCDPYYVSAEQEFLLPPLFGEEVELEISPDGEWVLLTVVQPAPGPTSVWEGAGSQLFKVSTKNLWSLGVTRSGPPRWSTDSSFVGWLTAANSEAELVVVRTSDRSAAVINLEPLGAPNHSSDEVVFIGR